MKVDIYGFKTQGIKYDQFRPQYPPNFFKETLSKAPRRLKYLDIATGTGKVLLSLAGNFTQSKGLDISQKMIQVCQAKTNEMKFSNISFETVDYMKWKTDEKYDLITIGEALHYLPVEESLCKAREMLKDDGLLAIYGYFLKGVYDKTGKERKSYTQAFDTFLLKKVKPYFAFNLDELIHLYGDQNKYPFQKLFQTQKQIQEVITPISKEAFLGYLRSLAGYNLYMKANNDDPIEELEKIIEEETVSVVEDHFLILCKKSCF